MTDAISYHTTVLVAAALPVVYAAARDLREFKIPNECSLLLLALYPLHVWLSPVPVSVPTAAPVAVIVFAVTYGLYALKRFGGGDVKLLSALALWAGPGLIADLVVMTSVAGGVLALAYLSPIRHVFALTLDRVGDAAARDNVLAERLPYGLAIAVGGLVCLYRLAG